MTTTRKTQRLAIDNGTFNSAGAVRLGAPGAAGIHLILDSAGLSFQGQTIASFIEFSEDGARAIGFGEVAKRSRAIRPKHVIHGMKLLVGLSYSKAKQAGLLRHLDFDTEPDSDDRIVIVVGQARYSPEECLRLLFLEIKRIAERDTALCGQPVDSVIISHPAVYDASRVACLVDAARGTPGSPGFSQVETIAEPTAAAIRYGVLADREQIVAVYDLGAGTLDVSVVRLRASKSAAERAVSGHEACGGMDMDLMILDGLRKDPLFMQGRDNSPVWLLRDLIEMAKIVLSSDESTIIPGPRPYLLTRDKLERFLEPMAVRLVAPISEALNKATISAGQLDAFLMVGGPANMPLVRKLLAAELTRLGARPEVVAQAGPRKDLNPMTAVVEGAALADQISKTIPEGFGVLLGAGQRFYSPLIHPGDAIPTSVKEAFVPLARGSRTFMQVEMAVKKTISGKAAYTSIGEFPLFLNPSQDPTAVVECSIDGNKALSVRVFQQASPKEHGVLFKNANFLLGGELEGLSEEAPSSPPDDVPTIDQQWDELAAAERLAALVREIEAAAGSFVAEIRALKCKLHIATDTAAKCNVLTEALHNLRVAGFDKARIDAWQKELRDLATGEQDESDSWSDHENQF